MSKNFYIVLSIAVLLGVASYFWDKRKRRILEANYSPELADDVRMRLFPDEDPERLKALFELYNFRFWKRGTYIIQPQLSEPNTFTYRPPPGAAQRIASKMFAADEIDRVINVLNRYNPRSSQSDREAILLNILKMSRGEVAKLDPLVDSANEDFRDVCEDYSLKHFVNWLLEYVDLDTGGSNATNPRLS